MKKNNLLVLCFICLFLSSCASIVNGSKDEVTITSNTEKTKIQIKDKKGFIVYTGYTPITLEVDRSEGYFERARYVIEAKADGYTPITARMDPSISGWYIVGNLFSFGLAGYLIVDPLTGGMYNFDEVIELQMTPIGEEFKF